MEVKHVIPAYSSAGQGEENRKDKSKFDALLSAVKNFPNKFKRKSSTDSNNEYSDRSSSRFNRNRRNNRSIKEKVLSKLPGGFSGVPSINKRSLAKWGAITVISAAILVGGARYVNSTEISQGDNSSRTKIKGPRATHDVNREFAFPLRDSAGDTVSDLKYTIEKAELRDEILVKGQKATAVQGRDFLILTLKLTNEYTQSIEIDTRDYVRLSVNGNEEEWLAPDIHNDPVEVQALSTKYTRVGFAINEDDEDILLRVGEIRGDKEVIEVDL